MALEKLSDYQADLFLDICRRLNVAPDWLYTLIEFESRWNPKAKNPYSTAKGLIQFIDSTAKSLGYYNSQELIDRHPTIESQLPVVERYLTKFKPFPTIQSLFMAVFYPAARNYNLDQNLPDSVQAVNPGIKTVRDYINLAYNQTGRKAFIKNVPALVLMAIAIFFLIHTKKRRNRNEQNSKKTTTGNRTRTRPK